jgi:hypothetical protein
MYDFVFVESLQLVLYYLFQSFNTIKNLIANNFHDRTLKSYINAKALAYFLKSMNSYYFI